MPQIGEGAFSVVKEGIHKKSGRSYAVKVVTKAKLLDVEEAKLQDEISMLKKISHGNIVTFVDVFDETQHYFIVTELMAGGDVLGRLNSIAFFDEKQGRRICKSLLLAVEYLHSHKIAHRDIKPENGKVIYRRLS